MVRSKDEILKGMSLPSFLFKCKVDFKFFAEQCLGVTDYGGIHPFQLNWVRLANDHKRLVIEAPAGFSKSQVMGAMYPVWLMLTQNNLKILLVNKTLEQGKSNLLSRIKGYISDNALLTEIFTPDDYRATWNMSQIKTKNGHDIKNVPYSENIRGYRADFIFLDEVDTYDDTNIFFEHVTSRLYPNGTMILMSTPVGPTRLIGQLKEKARAKLIENYYFEKTTALVDKEGNPAKIVNQEDINQYISIWSEMWSIKTLYDKWGEQGKANWMRNYMVECLGEIDDAIFPGKNILKSFDYNRKFSEEINPMAMYFIGADFAISDGPRADFDAFTVVEKINDQYIIKSMEVHKGWQRPEKVNRLEELYLKYDSPMGTYIIGDQSNMGTMVINDLRNRGVPIQEQSFHGIARNKLLISLGSVFAGKGIIIPRDVSDEECVKYSELLKEQLIGFKRKRSEKTGSELIESRATHDDLVMSLAMAISEAIKHSEMSCLPIAG